MFDGELIRHEIEKQHASSAEQTDLIKADTNINKKSWKTLFFELESIPLSINPKDQLPDVLLTMEDGMPTIQSSAPPGNVETYVGSSSKQLWTNIRFIQVKTDV